MTTTIEVRSMGGADPLRFEVIVRDDAGTTHHEVTMKRTEYEQLAGRTFAPENCVDAAFRFLLDREPKEAILARFDIAVIANYFPEFSREFPQYLASR